VEDRICNQIDRSGKGLGTKQLIRCEKNIIGFNVKSTPATGEREGEEVYVLEDFLQNKQNYTP